MHVLSHLSPGPSPHPEGPRCGVKRRRPKRGLHPIYFPAMVYCKSVLQIADVEGACQGALNLGPY